eukprot:scaffold43920_cov69-Phaeocystis_antarctica.AAC.5
MTAVSLKRRGFTPVGGGVVCQPKSACVCICSGGETYVELRVCSPVTSAVNAVCPLPTVRAERGSTDVTTTLARSTSVCLSMVMLAGDDGEAVDDGARYGSNDGGQGSAAAPAPTRDEGCKPTDGRGTR